MRPTCWAAIRVSMMCLVAALATGPGAVLAAPSDGIGIQPRVVSGGDAGAAGNAGKVTPNLFMGAFTYPIPVEVAPGRQDMQPDLFITYKSNRGNGWLGMGWGLEVGAIQRSTRGGVDFAGDSYVLDGAELTRVTSRPDLGDPPEVYRSLVESDFNRVRKLTANDGLPYFEKTDPKGVRFIYGSRPGTRQDSPTAPSQIFKWCLDQIIDADGNYLTVTYVKDQGEIYPDRIDYTGHASGPAPVGYVKFYGESRTDVLTAFRTGFRVTTAYRLRSIEVVAASKRLRAYGLRYASSAPAATGGTGRSTLWKVETYGSDVELDANGVVNLAKNPSKLPDTTLGTATGGIIPWTPASGPNRFFPGDIAGGLHDVNRVRVADFNGDGRADLAYIEGWGGSTPTPMKIYMATATGFAAPIDGPAFMIPSDHDGITTLLSRIKTGDFNGDGKADLAFIQGDSEYEAKPILIYLAKSDGSGFQDSIPGPLRRIGHNYSGTGYHPGVRIDCSRILVGDFNGDGKADLAAIEGAGPNPAADSGGLWPLSIYLSNGTGFGDPTTGPAVTAPGDAEGLYDLMSRFKLGDFNGDGKLDIAFVQGFGQTLPIQIYLARRSGGGFEAAVNGPTRTIGHNYSGAGYHDGVRIDCGRILAADFNGDGLTDLVALEGVASTTASSIYYSNGSGFEDAVAGPYLTSPGDSAGMWDFLARVKIGDFNGDGRPDLAVVAGWNSTTAMDMHLSYGSTYAAPVPGPARHVGDQHDWVRIAAGTVLVADFNGDGRDDLIGQQVLGGTAPLGLYYSSGTAPDLVTSISNGLGGASSISYAPSSTYTNTLLPFVVQTLAGVATSDGRGTVAATQYTYSEGYYSSQRQEFRGFNHATLLGPVGPSGERVVQETWFHQGDDVAPTNTLLDGPVGFMTGRPYLERTTDTVTGAYRLRETTYWDDLDGDAPYFNPPSGVESVTGRPAGASAIERSSVETYSYDQYGNRTRVDRYGDPADLTDDTTTVLEFSVNPSAWILAAPSSAKVYRGTYPGLAVTQFDPANLLSQTDYYYDGVQDAACTNLTTSQAPTRGHVTRVRRWLNGGTSPDQRFGYDLYGNQACERDANGNLTTFAYDSSKTFRTSSVNALGHAVIQQFYGVDGVSTSTGIYGRLRSTTDANGATTEARYDALGRRTMELLPDGTSRAWTYSAYGSPSTNSQYTLLTDQSGGQEWQYLDGLGRQYLVKTKRSSGGRTIATRVVFNSTGTTRAASLPYLDGVETPKDTRTEFDSWGRAVVTTAPDGRQVRSCFDDALGLSETITGIQSTNPSSKGTIRRQEHDLNGRTVASKEFKGAYSACWTEVSPPYATTAYRYDHLGRLLGVTDANGVQVEVIDYDTLGRKRFQSTPALGTWYFDYDGVGNLTLKTDARSQSTWMAYDALNRLSTETYSTGRVTSYGYDDPGVSYSRGRLTSVTDLSGTTTYGYDVMGRPTAEARLNTVDGSANRVDVTHDALGRLLSVTYPGPTGLRPVATYTYDADGNLQSVTDGTVALTLTGYSAVGQPATLSFGNGVVTTSTYDPSNNKLQRTTTKLGTSSLLDLTLGYNDAGLVASVTDAVSPTLSVSYGYDELSRLVSATGTALGSLGYAYGPTGNIVAKEGVTYTYDAINTQAVTATSDGKAYAYDANGNMVSEGSRTMTYDEANRLSMVTIANAQTTFAYDYRGQRTVKQTPSSRTVYTGKFYECTTALANGQKSCSRFIYAGDLRVAAVDASGAKYFHADHLGSIRAVTGATGAIMESIAYKPFGEILSDTGPAVSARKFTGQTFDAETGLYYYNARYYNALLGRFVSPDTLVTDPSNPQDLNRYSYVLNNPVNLVDPSGHSARGWKFAGSALIMAATLTAAIVTTVVPGAQWAAPYLWSAFIGEVAGAGSGGYSAYRASGGDMDRVANGALLGTVVGGAAGAAGASLSSGMSTVYGGMVNGAANGAAQGAISAYAGGKGASSDIWKGAAIGAFLGAAIGGAVAQAPSQLTKLAQRVGGYGSLGHAVANGLMYPVANLVATQGALIGVTSGVSATSTALLFNIELPDHKPESILKSDYDPAGKP